MNRGNFAGRAGNNRGGATNRGRTTYRGGPSHRGAGGPSNRGAGGPSHRGADGPSHRGADGPSNRGAGGPTYRGAGGPNYRGGPTYRGAGGPTYRGGPSNRGGPTYRGGPSNRGGPTYRGGPTNRGGPNKRKWVPDNKTFEGSLSEGQGFAFRIKQKVQHEYNKILTKERRKKLQPKSQLKEEYPEHLRHLYEAESAKLKNEALANRSKRSLGRIGVQSETQDTDSPVVEEADALQAASTEPTAGSGAVTDQGDGIAVKAEAPAPAVKTEAPAEKTEAPAAKEKQQEDSLELAKPLPVIPMSNRMKRKLMRKSSYQVAQEEFQEANEKRKKKNEEFLTNKQKKEASIQKYKDKKKEMFQVLSKKTKKGQPNLNLQMEYLLQKIQGPQK